VKFFPLLAVLNKRLFTTTNQELLKLYWTVGQYISDRLKAIEWGQKTIEELSKFIQA
jgi:hypothetical protein